MKLSRESLKKAYGNLKDRRWSKNSLTFFGFMLLSALFWLVMTLNDNVQTNVTVRLNINNRPDSAVFISVPPSVIHVNVKDKGTSLLRAHGFRTPVMNLNFRDFAVDGVFRVPRTDFQAALKSVFGQNAVITSSSLDSLYFTYTTNKGKRVPIIVNYNATAANGMTISGLPDTEPHAVTVYARAGILDTITRVRTECISLSDLKGPVRLQAKILPIAGVRVIPDRVSVLFQVESLVRKTSQVDIRIDNVPEGEDLLIFPQRARISYYVPMRRFNDEDKSFVVRVDYNDIRNTPDDRIPLTIERTPDYATNISLIDRSVEYTIVKNRQ